MAFYTRLNGGAKAALDAMREQLVSRAMTQLGLPRSEVVLRPMRPEDVGLSNPTYGTQSIGTANTAATYINAATINSDRFVGIYGFHNAETLGQLDEVRIDREGRVARHWHVQPIINFENRVGYADDPVILDENTTLTVAFYARSTSTVSDFGFIGDVAERKGLLISP